MPPSPFRVLKQGLPLEEFPLHDSIDPGITYSPIFEELNVVRDYRLDAERWYSGGYTPQLMAMLLAHRRMASLVDLHIEQARIDKANRDSKVKRR